MPHNFTVRMISVDFVPSWENDNGTNGTIIGQWYVDVKDLPEELQKQLAEICTEATRAYFEDRKAIDRKVGT